jgi:hypothetical protein
VLLPAIQRGADVLGAHIILMVMDWDFSSADDCIGFAVLSLDKIRKDSGDAAGSGRFCDPPSVICIKYQGFSASSTWWKHYPSLDLSARQFSRHCSLNVPTSTCGHP